MSKYANLPDIDTAPDVYETEDVLPASNRRGEASSAFVLEENRYDDSDDEALAAGTASLRRSGTTPGLNEAIDESGLPSFDLAEKKFGALAAMTYTLYPSMTPRVDPTLPSASLPSGDSASLSIPEHPRARLRRLRYEMQELEQYLSQEPSTPTEQQPSQVSNAEAEEARKTARMMEELKSLQNGLRSLDVKAGGAKDVKRDGWEARLKVLEESISRSATPVPTSETSSAAAVDPSPDIAPQAGGKVADLDLRLATLETILGTQTTDPEDTRVSPVLPTLSKLDHLLTLLTQPRHLDAISRRIKLLLTDLDRAQASAKSASNKRQSTGGAGIDGAGLGLLSPNLGGSGMPASAAGSSTVAITPEQSQKLEQAFQLVPRLQPLLPLLPHLLARLRSLSDLHESAATFDGSVKDLQSMSARLAAAQKNTEAVIGRLEGSIKGNEEMIEGNFRALGTRVDEVRKRLEALGAQS